MGGFGSADDLDGLVGEGDEPLRQRIQRSLQATLVEALEPWKEIAASQKKVVRLLEDDNMRLLLQLARTQVFTQLDR